MKSAPDCSSIGAHFRPAAQAGNLSCRQEVRKPSSALGPGMTAYFLFALAALRVSAQQPAPAAPPARAAGVSPPPGCPRAPVPPSPAARVVVPPGPAPLRAAPSLVRGAAPSAANDAGRYGVVAGKSSGPAVVEVNAFGRLSART